MKTIKKSLLLILLSLFSVCQAENYKLLTIYKSENIKFPQKTSHCAHF